MVKESATAKTDQKETVEEPEEEVAEDESEPTPPEHLEKAREIIASVDKKEVKAVDARKKFKNACAICHGTKGNMEINGAKNLTKSKISLEEAVAQVYHGKGLMTPFKGILTDVEIVAVSRYVETFRN